MYLSPSSASELSWELRSVNHRYLEIGFRVPEEFRPLEPDIRRILGQHLSRGKVDAGLRFTPAPGAASSRLVVNRALVDRLFELHAEVRTAGGLEQEMDAQALMRWPGVVEEQAPDAEPLHAAALELVDQTPRRGDQHVDAAFQGPDGPAPRRARSRPG